MKRVRIEFYIESTFREYEELKLMLKEILESMGLSYVETIVEIDVFKDLEAKLALFAFGKIELPVLKLGNIFIKGRHLREKAFLEAAVKGYIEGLKEAD